MRKGACSESLSRKKELIAQPLTIAAIAEYFGPDEIREGDVIPAAASLITRLEQGSLGESGVVKL